MSSPLKRELEAGLFPPKIPGLQAGEDVNVAPFLMIVVGLAIIFHVTVVLVATTLRLALLCFREPWLLIAVLVVIVGLKLA